MFTCVRLKENVSYRTSEQMRVKGLAQEPNSCLNLWLSNPWTNILLYALSLLCLLCKNLCHQSQIPAPLWGSPNLLKPTVRPNPSTGSGSTVKSLLSKTCLILLYQESVRSFCFRFMDVTIKENCFFPNQHIISLSGSPQA